MRKIFSCVAMALFLLVSVTVFGGCSNSGPGANGSAEPSAELQSSVVDSSINDVFQSLRMAGTKFEVLKINKEEIRYVMHPSVKKVIKGVSCDAWPFKIEGTGVVQYRVIAGHPATYFTRVSYVAYYYVNSVGANKIEIEDVQVDKKSI